MSGRLGRPSPAMVVALVALVAALGGSAFAALGRNTVGTRQLKKNAVIGVKVKNGTLTGADVAEATLGSVPSAANAANSTNAANAANAAALGGNPPSAYASSSLEPVHRIGDPGEPLFQGQWANEGAGFEAAGFYKDQYGIVQLVGDVHSGATVGSTIFTLPEGYRPNTFRDFSVRANGDTSAATVSVEPSGDVKQFGANSTNRVSLNTVRFRLP